jgi:hypothetical protein
MSANRELSSVSGTRRRIQRLARALSVARLLPRRSKPVMQVSLEPSWTPIPECAQRTEVVRLPAFFSKEETEKILALGETVPVHRFLREEKWETRYLHADGRFATALPTLLDKLLAAAHMVDTQQGWGLLTGRAIGVRLAEMHRVQPSMSSTLLARKHYDRGSLLTLDVMLKPASAGGIFSTLEVGGRLRDHQFEMGDLLVFVSHKYHCVSGVEEGTRCVMVLELWEGEPRVCAHRCDTRCGECERGENEPPDRGPHR